ncbi:MAG: HEPN domain-containing protein [Treponema sp.]|nr:HEPN domain-containing protein [Treponema sp.]
MKSRAGDWLKQAHEDLSWARDSLTGSHWAAVCFTAQQIGEKCLKAIALARGASEIRSHSLAKIAESLGIDGDIAKIGRRLDAYYIATRYPDAFVEGAPFEYFDEDQAREALLFAERLVARASEEIEADG